MYPGFDPEPVDCWFGKITRSALNEFHERQFKVPLKSVAGFERVLNNRSIAEEIAQERF